jgi:hypothetical protein
MDKLPDKRLEATRDGKLSTALALNRAPSKELSTNIVVVLSINVDCNTNRPVEKMVMRMIVRDPIVDVITGTCRCRRASDGTDNEFL